MHVERQVAVSFEYDGMWFEEALRMDLLVEKALVIELKSVETLVRAHHKQVLSYLRLMHLPLALLINFGSATFKEGVYRIVNNHTNIQGSRLKINKPQAPRTSD